MYTSTAMSKSQNTSKRKKVAVIFGGRSPEHDVSVVSGLQALSALNNDIYEAFPLYIAPDGKWYIGTIKKIKPRKNKEPKYEIHYKKEKWLLVILVMPKEPCLVIIMLKSGEKYINKYLILSRVLNKGTLMKE